MFDKILIANRGEIACRVIRTARRMGVATVAVYSDADAQALHVAMADEAVHIGASPVGESYLVAERIIEAAKATGAQAIHPGYGFLSENPGFVEQVEAAGLVFIGPSSKAIRAMGLKDAAKRLMEKAGVPVVPGYHGEGQEIVILATKAREIGYPVLIKARAGGGGKGMRKVDHPDDFAEALAAARREAKAAFGDDRVLVEKYVEKPRHIEVQVFGDNHGNVVHLYERDCSAQRRHQKVIEEAPAPGMDQATRDAVTAAAVRAARAVNYQGAGTIEFIADASDGLKADRIWFMEMNTRLQVEHPVTEAITGVDLVEWQLRVAAGQPIPLAQADIPMKGWAMEARLYAEDPANGFLPSIGRLDHFVMPDDIRVDTGVMQGGEVSQFYDPMIAKLIVHEDTREAAAARLADACREVEVWPVKTNAGFMARCLDHPRFVEGDVDTGFIAAEEGTLIAPAQVSARALAAAAGQIGLEADAAAFDAPDNVLAPARAGLFGFRLNAAPQAHTAVHHDGAAHALTLTGEPGWYGRSSSFTVSGEFGSAQIYGEPGVVVVDGEVVSTLSPDAGRVLVFDGGDVVEFHRRKSSGPAGGAASDGGLRAPMPGKIVAAPVKAGDKVAKGQPVVVLEAMKMEHALTAPFDGVVAEFNVAVGDQVSDGAVLAVVKAAEAA